MKKPLAKRAGAVIAIVVAVLGWSLVFHGEDLMAWTAELFNVKPDELIQPAFMTFVVLFLTAWTYGYTTTKDKPGSKPNPNPDIKDFSV